MSLSEPRTPWRSLAPTESRIRTDKRLRHQLGGNAKRRRDFPPAFLLLDEAPNYAVRMRARAARRFNARRSSSLRPPQTP